MGVQGSSPGSIEVDALRHFVLSYYLPHLLPTGALDILAEKEEPTMEIRTSCHFGRTSSTGRHNSRTGIDYQKAKNGHIDPERSEANLYWDCQTGQIYTGEAPDFAEVERTTYEALLEEGLEAQHRRNARNRHSERNRSISDILTDRRTRPDEIILQVGDKDAQQALQQASQRPEAVNVIMANIMNETIIMMENSFQNGYGEGFIPIDAALHRDEESQHIHVRGVYVSLDKEGYMVPNQKKALQSLGYDRPDPDKPEGRYNNLKLTFTADFQQRFNELVRNFLRQHVKSDLWMQISEIRHDTNTQHLDTPEYKLRQQAIDRAREAQREEGYYR